MSSGGTVLNFKVGTAEASGANARYISRERAVFTSYPGGAGPERSIAAEKEKSGARIKYIGRDGAGGVGRARPGFALQNMPQAIRDARTYDEMRRELASWASHRAEMEVKRHGERAGRARTHYRAIASYERKVPTSVALAGAKEWAQRCFPGARVAIFVHQDTDHTHIHIWIGARRLDGSKIHLGYKTYRSLDEKWNEIYCRQMGRDVGEHLRKKEQAKAIKDALYKGWQVPERPERATPSGPAVYEARDRRFERQEAEAKGERSFADRVRERAEKDLQEAKSLGELNARLAPKGLKVVSKGRGGVVRTLGETKEAKLSAVGRAFSWGKLHAAFEERQAEAERRRAMGASLARHLRRQRIEGVQRGVQTKEGAAATPLGLRIRAVRTAGEGLQRAAARRREERRQPHEAPGRAEEATAETPLPPKVVGALGVGAKLFAEAERPQTAAERSEERPAKEEKTGADWVSGVLAGQGDFSSYDLGEQSSESEKRSREETPELHEEQARPSSEPPQLPPEAPSVAENKVSALDRGEGHVSGRASSAPPEGARGDAATGRGTEEAGTDDQDAPEKEGDPELEEEIELGRRLHRLLTQVVEEKQREDTRRQVLAELEGGARRMERAFAERASMLVYETVRRQLAKGERDLLDACKEMREQQGAEAAHPAKADQAAPTPESKAEAGRGEEATSERDRPGAAEEDEAAADDVARQLVERVREIAALDRSGSWKFFKRARLARKARDLRERFVEAATDEEKRELAKVLSEEERQLVARDFDRDRSVDAEKSAGTAAPTEARKEGVSMEEAEKAAFEQRREVREADAAPKDRLRWLLRQIRRTRGRVQKKHSQEAHGLVRELMRNAPGPERQRFVDSLPGESKAVLNKIAQAVRAAQDRRRREGNRNRKGVSAKQKTRDRKTGGESRRADAKADRRSEAALAVEEKLKAALRAFQVLDERVERASKAKTPEARQKAGAAVKQARDHYGTEHAVRQKIIELAGQFANRSTDAERDAFEAGLPDQISQRRFRAAVQKSKEAAQQQRGGPDNDRGRDSGDIFELG